MDRRKPPKAKPKAPKPDTGAKAGGLTLKQARFVAFYLGEANGNATEAARMAGYATPAIQGHENLRKPNIRSEIDARLAEAAMSAREVVARLSSMAAVSAADFLSVDDKGKWHLDLARAQAAGKLHLVRSIRETKNGVSVELHDAQAALEKLGRYHGLFLDKPPPPPASDQPDDMAIPDEDDRPEPIGTS